MKQYDVVIISSERNLKNLPLIVESMKTHLHPSPDKIYCITPIVKDLIIDGVEFIEDAQIGNYQLPSIRPNWMKQQYIKLFQTISKEDYLVIDSDILITRKLNVLNIDGKINLFGVPHTNYPSFQKYNKEVFGLEKVVNFGFVTELMMFNRKIINELISKKFESIDEFIKETNRNLEIGNILSEYELYANYVLTYHPDNYSVQVISITPTNVKINSMEQINSRHSTLLRLT